MTTRNKRKLAALNKENCEEHPRSNLAQNSSAHRSQEDYMTQVSEEIEGRVTKRLSKEFSRTENRILGALAGLDDFLMNPLLPGHSGDIPERVKHKPGNERGRLPEWSSSWSGPLPRSDDTKLWPRRRPRQGLFREWSPVGSRFSELLFLDVPGTATEQVRTCGFRRNSSSLDRAPKIRDSVRLNSFESFLVTLPSISSETWEMYSWDNSESSVFCDRLFLAFSGVSLETAANFLLFLSVAMIRREKFCKQWRLVWSFYF